MVWIWPLSWLADDRNSTNGLDDILPGCPARGSEGHVAQGSVPAPRWSIRDCLVFLYASDPQFGVRRSEIFSGRLTSRGGFSDPFLAPGFEVVFADAERADERARRYRAKCISGHRGNSLVPSLVAILAASRVTLEDGHLANTANALLRQAF